MARLRPPGGSRGRRGRRLHGDSGGCHLHIEGTIPLGGPDQRFELGPGETVAFGLTANHPGRCGSGLGGVEGVRATLGATREYWWIWANACTYDGAVCEPEQELDHLAGYRGSPPVRTGNGAADQLQLDIDGEALDCAYLYASRGGDVSGRLWSDLSLLADRAARRWREPDASVWEMRGTDQQLTRSKVMCWVALDRAVKIARRRGLPGDLAGWEKARRQVRHAVMSEGWSASLGADAQAFGGDALDAAALRLVQVGSLDPADERLVGTIDAIDRRLSAGPMLRRDDTGQTDDGLSGGARASS